MCVCVCVCVCVRARVCVCVCVRRGVGKNYSLVEKAFDQNISREIEKFFFHICSSQRKSWLIWKIFHGKLFLLSCNFFVIMWHYYATFYLSSLKVQLNIKTNKNWYGSIKSRKKFHTKLLDDDELTVLG